MSAELLAVNIAAHWVQAGILSAAAALAIRLLNLNEPRSRLAALHLTVIAIVALPLLQPWKTVEPAVEVTSSATVSTAAPIATHELTQSVIEPASWANPSSAIVAIVIAGVALRLLWLLLGILRLSRFSRAASSVPTPAVAWEIESDLAVAPRYIQQIGGRGPWTFGWIRPAVALPAGFDSLAPAFQRAVVCHELVHIKRRDILVSFLEELAMAALWFHPWMWLLRARIRVAREQVVDSRVVAMLDNRDEYVRCLVDMSGHDLAPHFSQAGAGMLRPRELRARVDAIFQEVHMSRMRFAVAALAFVAVTTATGLIAVAAMPLRAASLVSASTSNELPTLVSRFLIADGPATPIRWRAAAPPQTAPEAPRRQINKVYPAYPQDALERGIKGVVIVDITINAAGDVSTAGVVSGPQELRASAFAAALGLKYTPGKSVTAMQIAFEYMLTGTTWGVKIGEALPNMGLRPQRATEEIRRAIDTLEGGRYSNPDATGAYRIGGGLMPPKKIKDAAPVYPPIAQEARVQGVVILEARVDENGNVSDVRVLRSIPLLDQAAIDSVKQWQYTPTTMNGVPVPVIMTMTVNFSLSEILQIRVVLPDGNSMPFDMKSGALVNASFTGVGAFQLKASRERGSNDATVSVFTDDGQTHVGDVVVTLNGPVVQSPTTPSIGLQFIGVR
jgi:TonB family protein